MRRFQAYSRSIVLAAGLSPAASTTPATSAPDYFSGNRDPVYESYSDLSEDCDNFAASPSDLENPREVKGVYADDINLREALYACGLAARSSPQKLRIRYQYGRVLHRAGYKEQALEETAVAAQQGYLIARTQMGGILLGGTEDRAPDHEKAFRWFELAAKGGDVHGTRMAARMLDAGKGVPIPSPERAVGYWRALAAKGDPEARERLRVASSEQKAMPIGTTAPRAAENVPVSSAKPSASASTTPRSSAKDDSSWMGWAMAGVAGSCLYFETCRNFAGEVVYDIAKKKAAEAVAGK